MPINQLQHLVRIATRKHHHEHRAPERRPRQIKSRDETAEDECEHHTNSYKQTAVESRNNVRFPFDHCSAQNLSKTRSQDYEVDGKSDDRRRRKRQRKSRKPNVRKMPDDHVLRIAYERGTT